MAQAKLTAFYNSRKKNDSFHASKRRKLQDTSSISETATNNDIATTVHSKTEESGSNKPVTRRNTRSRTKTQIKLASKNKVDISESLSSIVKPNIKEISTAACDDHHSSPPSTPTKILKNDGTEQIGGKRARQSKAKRKDLLKDIDKTPEELHGYDFNKSLVKSAKNSTKKRLFLKGTIENPKDIASKLPETEPSIVEIVKSKITENTKSEVQIEKLIPHVIPQETQKGINHDETSKIEDASNVTKASINDSPKISTQKPVSGVTSKKILSTEEMKSKLQRCGKLEDLKKQLAEFQKAKAKSKPAKTKDKLEATPSVKTQSKPTPAFEKFFNLAIPLSAELALPYTYRLLMELFVAADTVVSMMHKRCEICTFSKMKTSVQSMTRKSFEEKSLGQIVQVYPTAYHLRQEKGIPQYGGKSSSYQLTVESDLETDLKGFEAVGESTDVKYDADNRPIFTASRLLFRKEIFKRNLVAIVKDHHQNFLSNLERPMKVPHEKITRWHPKFKLDEVPEISPADLPKPPNYKTFTTAGEVLQEARGNFSPMVKNALRITALESRETNENTPKPSTLNDATKRIEGKTEPKQPETKAKLSGVSQSLLERIRAKESQKQIEAMTRSPAEESRLHMMERLPSIVRIVRSYFVTQKKPCLEMETAAQKVADSYKSSMSLVEAEKHLKLMVELLPEWVTLIKVKSGTFLKIDRNRDIAVVTKKLDKLIKEKK